MSTPAIQPSAAPAEPERAPVIGLRRRRRTIRRIVPWLVSLLLAASLAPSGLRLYRSVTAAHVAALPTTRVKRGDVSLTVVAKAELRGGNSEELATPMTGDTEMHITFLRKPGELVKEGDA